MIRLLFEMALSSLITLVTATARVSRHRAPYLPFANHATQYYVVNLR